MTSKPIRIGIVGATVTPGGSQWGSGAHVPAIQALPDVELKAVCTSRPETARASAEKFGADLAFHDIQDMVAHPDIDLVVVCVRVPWHHGLAMAGLRAGKPVFCEWPLGANLAEAEEMAETARAGSLFTAVGLQGRNDPHASYARDLIADGAIGEVLVASMIVNAPAVVKRDAARIWQADRSKGANPLTIPGGHAIDTVNFVLGEFTDVSARLATRIPTWLDTDTGAQVPVTAPDTISVAGRLASGAEIAVQVATVPVDPRGTRVDVHGTEGSLSLTTTSQIQMGPNQLFLARGSEPLTQVEPPPEYTVVPTDAPTGRPRNVAQAYVRIAEALASGTPYAPDFDAAVRRHRLLAAIERSAETGQSVSV